MGRVIDLLHATLSEIQTDGSQMLDFEYVMSIFQHLCNDLPEFESYMRYFLDEKSGHGVGSRRGSDQVLSIDEAMVEIFWPTKVHNHETTKFCCELAVCVATTWLIELEDTSKATYQHLSAAAGKYNQVVISKEEELTTIGLRANNNPL